MLLHLIKWCREQSAPELAHIVADALQDVVNGAEPEGLAVLDTMNSDVLEARRAADKAAADLAAEEAGGAGAAAEAADAPRQSSARTPPTQWTAAPPTMAEGGRWKSCPTVESTKKIYILIVFSKSQPHVLL